MKKIRSTILITVSVVCCILQFSYAQNTIDPLSLPPLTQLVTDHSAVLDESTLSGLNEQAFNIQQETTAQIASVLFPNRNGNELFDIGMRVFRESGIGQVEKNNGILLLIATEEKKLRIIVGYGLEGTIPDILASDLIESQLRPLVNEGKRGEAISTYQQFVAQTIRKEGIHAATLDPNSYQLSIRDFFLFFIRAGTTIRTFRPLQKKQQHIGKQLGPILPFVGLFLLIFLTLPGILGAFLGYFAGIIGGSILFPQSGRQRGPQSYRGGSSGGRNSGGFGGGFSGFGGGSSGGGGAGD